MLWLAARDGNYSASAAVNLLEITLCKYNDNLNQYYFYIICKEQEVETYLFRKWMSSHFC